MVESATTVDRALAFFYIAHPDLKRFDLALFTMGGIELTAEMAVYPDDDLILRPRVIH